MLQVRKIPTSKRNAEPPGRSFDPRVEGSSLSRPTTAFVLRPLGVRDRAYRTGGTRRRPRSGRVVLHEVDAEMEAGRRAGVG